MPVPMPQKPKKEFSWGRFSKTLSFWILILLIPVVLIQLSGSKVDAQKQVSYTQYRDELEKGNIQRVQIVDGKVINGTFGQRVSVGAQGEAKNFTVRLPVANSEAEVAALTAKGVAIEAKDAGVSITAWILNF